MKGRRVVLLVILAALPLLACRGWPSSATPVAPTQAAPHPFDVAWDDRALFREGLLGDEEMALEQLSGASVYHIDFHIPEDFAVLEGSQRVRYTNQEEITLDEVPFRLFPNLAGGEATVSGVKVDGEDVEPIHELEDSVLRLPLPTPLRPGEHVVIEMDFEVSVPREMGGNYGLFGYFDGFLVLDEFYPVIPVYDDEGWNVEIPPDHGDVTYLDASFYLVRVTAPRELMVIASGVEVGCEYVEDSQVLTFAAGPSRDFYVAASDQYAVLSESVGGTTVNSYAPPQWEEGAEQALQVAVDALESFDARFGSYPYAELDVVGTPMMALGMEYPGVITILIDAYDPDEQIAGLPSSVILESTTAHEVAHQWFYNVVGNDQVDEPWVDEAVVQYATGLYYIDTYGEGAARGYRDSWYGRWDRVDRADIPIGLPVASYEGSEYGAIVYGRGPIFVAALADEMGQEPFDAFLRDYFQSHKWGIGTADSFRQLAEEHCECDLTPLFEEWVYGD